MEKTIRDLCKRVAHTHGFDTDNESIVAYQDLIGHATQEENHDISNAPELMESFYQIYGAAYGTVAAIKFYLQNSDKMVAKENNYEIMKDALEEHKTMLDSARKAEDFWRNKAEEYKGMLAEAKRDMEGTEKRLKISDADMVTLKARLYDLLVENDELQKRLLEGKEKT